MELSRRGFLGGLIGTFVGAKVAQAIVIPLAPAPVEPPKVFLDEYAEVNIDDLILCPIRKADKRHINALKASIAAQGVLMCPLVTRDLRVIDGIYRVVACKALGHKTIHVRFLDTDAGILNRLNANMVRHV